MDPLQARSGAEAALRRITEWRLLQKRGKKPPTTILSCETSAVSKRRQHSKYQVHQNGSISHSRKLLASTQEPSATTLSSTQEFPPPIIPELVDHLAEVDLGI